MANLKTMETRGDFEERLRWKVWMVRELYKRGIKDEQIIRLVRLVDWMMGLPEPLQERFEIEWGEIEEEFKMMYMMDIERKGYDRGILVGVEQGREEGIEQGIEQGREEGIEQGIEQGREEGIEQGIEQGRQDKRDMILQLLHHRFEIDEALSLMIQIRLQLIEDKDEFVQLINHAMDIEKVEHFLQHLSEKIS